MELINKQEAIKALKRLILRDEDGEWDTDINDAIYDAIGVIRDEPSVQLDLATNLQQTCNQLATDCISRQAAIDAVCKACANSDDYVDCIERRPESTFCDEIVSLRKVPSAQPILYGYNIEHLELIARVLQKENLSPERVVEILTDIGRIVAIVRDEFEETLRKAVEQCMT